jgi:hypothetical protein
MDCISARSGPADSGASLASMIDTVSPLKSRDPAEIAAGAALPPNDMG